MTEQEIVETLNNLLGVFIILGLILIGVGVFVLLLIVGLCST